jgi:tetratricopeptide (TPR) repeat protein
VSTLSYLLNGDPGSHSLRSIERRLATAWGFPADPELRALAVARGGPFGEVRGPDVGDALLVAVGPPALLRLRFAARARGELTLLGQAAHAARLAQRLVLRDLPLLPALRPEEVRVPGVDPFAAEGPVHALDGASYGVGFALAAASALLDAPVPHDLVATGTLGLDGAVEPVEAVGEKARLVLEHALGAQRLLVPRGQAEEAIRALELTARRHGLERAWAERPWLSVVEVTTLAEAVLQAFPDPLEHMRRRLVDAAARDRLASALFRIALFGTPLVLSWHAVEACATELRASFVRSFEPQATLPDAAEPVRTAALRARLEQLTIVEAIAARHQGRPALLPVYDAAHVVCSRAERLRLMAHQIQAYADGLALVAAGEVRARLEAARSELRPRCERAPEDAVLLGAIGRAWAALGEASEALEALHDAVLAWIEVHRPCESSYALSAFLRLAGIEGSELFLAMVAEPMQQLEADPQTSEKSLGYVRLAHARALVQLGRAAEARALLEDTPGRAPLPHEVESARVRWLARALDDLGQSDAARALRATLRAETADPEQCTLAALDQALRDGASCDDLASELRAAAPPCPPSHDEARWIAERSFY